RFIGMELGGDGNLVAGNSIGTDKSGSVALGNAGGGLSVAGQGNTVGGTTAGARNLISGNGISGIEITGTNNLVVGDYVGTDAKGKSSLKDPNNPGDGVLIDPGASGNTVGGTTAGARNLISGNG